MRGLWGPSLGLSNAQFQSIPKNGLSLRTILLSLCLTTFLPTVILQVWMHACAVGERLVTGVQKSSTQYMHSLILFSHLTKLRDVAWKMLAQKKGWFTSWIAGFFTVHPKCFAQIETWWFRYGEVFCYGVSIFSHQYAGWKNHIRMSTDWLKSVRTFDF